MTLYFSKKIPALLKETMSKQRSDFYFLNCLRYIATENKRESHKKVCENKYFFNIAVPSEDTEVIEFN